MKKTPIIYLMTCSTIASAQTSDSISQVPQNSDSGSFWWMVLVALIAWLSFRIYSRVKKRRAAEAQARWLSDLQKAHDTKDYPAVLALMKGKELSNERLCIVLGNALLMTGDADTGRKVLRKAFTYSDSNKNEVRKLFGFAELNAGNYKQAISILQEIEKDYIANELKFDDGYDIIENLGVAFMKLEKHDLAIEALKAAPLGKKNITDGLNRIFILLAECYEQKGDKKNAAKFYTKSLAYKYDDKVQACLEDLQHA